MGNPVAPDLPEAMAAGSTSPSAARRKYSTHPSPIMIEVPNAHIPEEPGPVIPHAGIGGKKSMKTRDEARERAIELAIKHGSIIPVASTLDSEGLGGLLERFELESIIVEADSIRRLLPERPRKTLPRIIGLVAVTIGSAGMWIGTGAASVGRHSPGGYGILAVILGVILIVKPSSANTDIS